MKKQENESSGKVLEENACIDRAHRVSKTDETVIVRFTTFRHRTIF